MGKKKKEETPLVYALDSLREIRDHRMMPSQHKAELAWLVKKIESNRLNEVSIDREHPLFKDQYAHELIKTYTVIEPSSLFDCDSANIEITKIENEEEI